MKQLKIFIVLLLAFAMLFTIVACNTNVETQTDKVETTKAPAKIDIDYPKDIQYNGEDSVAIHYIRKDNKYSTWCLWLWDPQGTDDSVEDVFNYQDEDGVIAYYPLSKFGDLSSGKLGIIIKKVGSWTKDGTENDRFIEFSKFTKDANKVYHVYFFGGDAGIYQTKDKTMVDSIESAIFDNEKTISVSCSNNIKSYEIYKDETKIGEGKDVGKTSFTYTLGEKVDLKYGYKVKVTFEKSNETLEKGISLYNLYSSALFDAEYYYSGELGAIYSQESTTFKVWSPVSNKIELVIYKSGTPTSVSKELGSDECQVFEMTKGEKGVFSCKINGDLHGLYYTYKVYNSSFDGVEVVDPYAKGAGVNGLRGLVVDFSRTNPDGWDDVTPLAYDRKSLVVYETHVSDVTSHSTWGGSNENKRKYLGLIEEGTTYQAGPTSVKTGFDHILELGVNAVQLLPIFDQANDEVNYAFNWGYNPLNYNVVEGLYSSDPYDGLVRINELKQVIQKFNENGITTIMDVVYNHVNGANGSNFDVLMPNYYFRYNKDGSLSNGSGCGNEVASERSMVRKFIVDSTKFWTEEYKLGGFRFDLMGLIDIETMDELTKECTDINPYMVIYGEPWQGGSSPLVAAKAATQDNANSFQGYGQFNDQTRDALIKGGLNDKASKGWVTNPDYVFQSDVINIQYGINGKTYKSNNSINDPNKNVIYATCHDNYTLYDRIKAAGINDEATIRKMAMLANSVVLTSNGTTFILSGEEMLRTKQGDNNSYKSSDAINGLNYGMLIKNNDIFQNYIKLIDFKKNASALCDNDPNIVVESLDGGSVLKYELLCEDGKYIVIHANGKCSGFSIDLTDCVLVLDTLNSDITIDSNTVIQAYQTIIVKCL